MLTSWTTPSLSYRITHPNPHPQYPYISKLVMLSLFKKNHSKSDLNLCAFVTGNQAGSPMPPRPPSQHESNPSSRMTQSPMATSKDTLFTAFKCIQPVQESSAVKWFKFVEAQFVMNDQQIMNYIYETSLYSLFAQIYPHETELALIHTQI